MNAMAMFSPRSRPVLLAVSLLALVLTGCVTRSSPAGAASLDENAGTPGEGGRPLVQFTPDPIEGFNRSSWVVSDGAMDWVIIPLARGYGFIVREPVRTSISKFGKNLAFPVRLINTLLQGKFIGARDETGRFLVNTTVGLLGFFDPARRWGLEPYNEDFGQTFGVWGMGKGFYLFLPVTGPSSGRDTLGRVGDTLANPATYIPGLGIFLTFNDLTFRIDDYIRLTNSQSDPYFLLREAWNVTRDKDVVDYVIPPEAYAGSAIPVEAAMSFLQVQNPEFRDRARTDKALIPSTGRELPYSWWDGNDSGDLVFILPGIGSHRDSGLSHVAAELIFDAGYTPVSLSSPFNWEFMNAAASAHVPGYTPFDTADVAHALAAVYADINRRENGRFNRVGVVGLSLGGLHTLFLAAGDSDGQDAAPSDDLPRPPYHRFVAISPPVDPVHALGALDDFYNAPLRWPADVREDRITETLYKAAIVAEQGLDELPGLPFDEIESSFLIGLGFRNILQNAIFVSQRRHDLGILQSPYRWSPRGALYDEIWGFGYADYMERFVLPYVESRRGNASPFGDLAVSAGLRSMEHPLAADPRVVVITNSDDFVLGPEDRQWLRSTFGKRLVAFPKGGHMEGLFRAGARSALARLFDPVEPGDSPLQIAPPEPGEANPGDPIPDPELEP